MICHLFLFYLVCGNLFNASSVNTTLVYDIVINDKVVGSLEATRKQKDRLIWYRSATVINTKIIRNIEVQYNYDVHFEDERLQSSQVAIYINTKSHANTKTRYIDDAYEITKNGKLEATITDAITYPSVLLYFKEPINITKCFSEQNGNFNTIESLENHSYKKTNAKGNENIYYYKNGVLDSAEIDGGLINFRIIATK